MRTDQECASQILNAFMEMCESSGTFGRQGVVRGMLDVMAEYAGDSHDTAMSNGDAEPEDALAVNAIHAAITAYDQGLEPGS